MLDSPMPAEPPIDIPGKESDTKWIYHDVITAKNAIGADLPSRFVCTVTIKGERMSANVQF